MTNPQHTPGPWVSRYGVDIYGGNGDCLAQATTRDLPRSQKEKNAQRIVACVNGCAGITDPETTVPELVAALRPFAAIADLYEYYAEEVFPDEHEQAYPCSSIKMDKHGPSRVVLDRSHFEAARAALAKAKGES